MLHRAAIPRSSEPHSWRRMSDFFASLLDFLPDDPIIQGGAGVFALALFALAAYQLARIFALRFVEGVVKRTDNVWDDSLLHRRVFHRLTVIVPFVIVQMGAASAIPGEALADIVRRIAAAAVAIVVARAIGAFLNAVNDIYETFEVSSGRPIQGYLQVVSIVTWLMATTFAVAALVDRSPWGLLSGIGAISAVLLLIFKDTILSLVASIQLSSYDMLRVGDWITMPAFGADGTVIEVNLHTVRVQNFDKTIVGIPTHKFLDNAFTNWRGMSESGGRRIKRHLRFDLGSVRFLRADELETLSKVTLLRDYLEEKRHEVEQTNAARDGVLATNLRRLTNIGTFRAYVAQYLRSRGDLHDEFTFLVRQLPPKSDGLPLEIYVFTTTTAWVEYESIQADIFDHLLAVVGEFGLRLYQAPSSGDIDKLADSRTA